MKKGLLPQIGLALLRIVPSIMLMTHGWPKFQKLINGNLEFADPLGIGAAPSLFLAAIGEFVCPILIILGYKTRWAATYSAITMFIIGFVHHASDPFKAKEKALLFLAFFIAIVLLGPGKFGLDKD